MASQLATTPDGTMNIPRSHLRCSYHSFFFPGCMVPSWVHGSFLGACLLPGSHGLLVSRSLVKVLIVERKTRAANLQELGSIRRRRILTNQNNKCYCCYSLLQCYIHVLTPPESFQKDCQFNSRFNSSGIKVIRQLLTLAHPHTHSALNSIRNG